MSEIDPLQLVHAGQKRFSNEGMVEKEKQQRKHKGKAKLMSGSTNSPKKPEVRPGAPEGNASSSQIKQT